MIYKKNILGVGITDASKKEILEYAIKNLENFRKKLFFVTPNPEFLVLANKNTAFKNVLNRANLASADGIGVIIAAKILGKPLKERLTGVELVENLCKAVSEKPITVGFLGGGPQVAEKTAECLLKKYAGLKVVFASPEWTFGSTRPLNGSLEPDGNTSLVNKNESDFPADDLYKLNSRKPVRSSFRGESRHSHLTMKQFNNKTIDVLFVAFGAPKQEFWINENLDKIPVKIAIGVGGAFDYISGKVPRAPAFLRNMGLEWLFRLIVQPWRWKRQLAILEFTWLVFKEKLKAKEVSPLPS